jgi:hypothetical protein
MRLDRIPKVNKCEFVINLVMFKGRNIDDTPCQKAKLTVGDTLG